MRVPFRSPFTFLLRVLVGGYRGGLLYTGLIGSAALYLVGRAQILLKTSFLELAEVYEGHEHTFKAIVLIASRSCWIPAIPFLAVAVLLPACCTYRDGYGRLGTLIQATPSHVRVVSYAMLLSIRSIVAVFMPALAMVILYLYFAKTFQSQGISALYLSAMLCVLAISAWRALPYFFAPVLAVCGGLSPFQAVHSCEPVVRSRPLRFAGLVTCSALALGAARWSSHRFSPMAGTGYVVLDMAIFWAALTTAAFFVLDILTNQFSAPPQKEDSGALHGTTTNMQSPENVEVIVTRAWVND